MMNKGFICLLFLLVACTAKKIVPPETAGLSVRMVTEGADKFENYIHSLTVYAFRRTAGGTYVYDSTLAQLDAGGIAALEGLDGRDNTKIFKLNMPVGYYQLFFAANANGKLIGNPEVGVTLPDGILIPGTADGDEAVYFLGNVTTRIISDYMSPITVTLSRAVGKLIVVLRQVPAQLDSIRLQVGNISARVSIAGTLSDTPVTVRKSWKLDNTGVYSPDSVVMQVVTMPTISGSSPFQLEFVTRSGQEKIKDMPPLVFLPDKYIRVLGTIDDTPGALLSFDFAVRCFIFDFWQDISLPEISLTPDNP